MTPVADTKQAIAAQEISERSHSRDVPVELNASSHQNRQNLALHKASECPKVGTPDAAAQRVVSAIMEGAEEAAPRSLWRPETDPWRGTP